MNNILKSLFLCLMILTFVESVRTQPVIYPSKSDMNKLPAVLKYDGSIKEAFEWTDNAGLNIILYCETKDYVSGNDNPDETSRDFYIYYFKKENEEYKLVWKITDFVKNCMFDLETHFINNALSVTDLNENGINEIWVMYRFGCKSDVSPWPLKLIMYEGKSKFAMRGETRDYSNSYAEEENSPHTTDKKLLNADKRILKYAETLWKTNNLPQEK